MGGTDYQVVIIGGGPAGARSAELLARGGLKTLLLEAEGPDVDVLCSGLLNHEARQSLGRDLPRHVRREPFTPSLEFHDADNRLRYRYDPDYLNMDRPAFDAWLRELAAEAGATVEYHRRVSRIEPGEAGVVLTVGSERVCAPLVVDATGWRALSRKLFGGSANKVSAARSALLPQIHAFQGEVAAGIPEDAMWAIFDSSATSYYGWIVPKGGGRFLLGAGFPVATAATRLAGKSPWEMLSPFMDYVSSWGGKVQLIDQKPRGSLIACISSLGQLWWGRRGVFPVGEAAGLVSPSSGDGISYCLQSAAAVASVLTGTDTGKLGFATQGMAESQHEELSRRMRVRMRPLLAELNFNRLKAKVAGRPILRGLAARLLPLTLRRSVQRMSFGDARPPL